MQCFLCICQAQALFSKTAPAIWVDLFQKRASKIQSSFATQLVTKVGTFNVIRLYWGPGKFPLKNLKGIWDWGFIKDHWSSLKTFRVFKEPLGFQRDLQSVKGPLGFLGTYRDSRRILGFLWWSYDGHDMMVRMVASVIRRDADWQASVTGADLWRPPYQSPSWWWWWRWWWWWWWWRWWWLIMTTIILY